MIARFRDPDLRRELTDTAYADLIASGDYGYEKLIEPFDQVLLDAGLAPAASEESSELVARALHRPLHSRVGHNVAGLWGALAHNAPGVWKVLHVASRLLVTPIRAIQRLARR